MISQVQISREPDAASILALLARLATEVRQSLHHVLGAVELASDEPLSRPQIRHLGRCRESSHHLLRIAADVSELSDCNGLHETSTPFEPAEMLEAFGNLISVRAKRNGLELRWSVDRQAPRSVIGCRQAIESVLYRLVDNSIKFTKNGAITILAKSNPTADDRSAELAFEIIDTGPGIPDTVLQELQGPVSASPNSGLGLRLVRKQLAEIGGQMNVVSSDGRGTTMAIVCPVAIPMIDSNHAAAAVEGSRSAKLQLLLAEDSDDSYAVFEAFVKEEGHLVTRAVDGADAIEKFKHGTFDIVVMDVNMPVMDGYTATRAIRELETQQGRARLPILLLSAEDPRRQMRIGSSVGCTGYLTKPTPKRELLCALRSYARGA